MRVTLSQILDQFQTGISNDYQNLARTQQELASGQVISKPSDDPQGVIIALQAMRAQSMQMATDQYTRNTQYAQQWLDVSGTSLQQLAQTIARARDLGLQGRNSTLSSGDFNALSTEVDGLVQQAIQIGNSNYGGTYLFAGTNNMQPPFQADSATNATTVTYSGNDGSISTQTNLAQMPANNIPGDQLFNPVFSALIELRDSLNSQDMQNGDSNGAGGSIGDAITKLDAAFQNVTASQAQLGVLSNNMTTTLDRLSQQSLDASKLASVNNVDVAQAATDLAQQQAAYQAALNAGAKIAQISLLDFLH